MVANGGTRKEGRKTSDTVRIVRDNRLRYHTSTSHSTENTGNKIANSLRHCNPVLDTTVADAVVKDLSGKERLP